MTAASHVGFALLASALVTTGVHAAGNNDYVNDITLTTNVGSSINGLNVDRATGKVYAAFNHSVSVYPAGAGGQPAELSFPVDPTGGSGASPSGTVFQNNRFYVSAYWRTGAVFSYDAQGQNQQTAFVVNDQVPYQASAPGSVGMTSTSTGDLVLASLNMPNAPPRKTGLVVKGVDGTTRWLAHPSVDPTGDVLQVAVDQQDNVYAAGDGFGQYVQMYDAAGTPLRQIGPVQGPYSAGVAVDRCNYVYISSGNNTVEKFDPAGQKIATLTDTTRTYGSNRGSTPVSVDAAGRHIYMVNASNGFYAVWTQTTTAPPAPVVQAVVTAPLAIKATWVKAAECISAYQLQISADQGASWTSVALNGVPLDRTITPADTTLTAGATYLLRVSATDADGTSVYSAPVSVTLPAAALPPPVITATGHQQPPRIAAQWQAPASNISSYLLEVSDSAAGNATPLQITVPGSQTSRDITAADVPGLAEGQTYTLRVSATSPAGTSAFSQPVQVSIPRSSGIAPATPVPTLGEWGLLALAAFMVLVGIGRTRKAR